MTLRVERLGFRVLEKELRSVWKMEGNSYHEQDWVRGKGGVDGKEERKYDGKKKISFLGKGRERGSPAP